jgi:hypothetical protein
MKPPHEKPGSEKEATIDMSRTAEIRKFIEDYVNDLRKIVERLRRKMN